MGYPIQQANTLEPLRFLMVLAADHITGATGLSPTVTLAKVGGGGFLPPAGLITELGVGWYSIDANPTDASTLGPLLLHATAPLCDPTDDVFDVVSYNPTAFAPVTVPAGPTAINALDLISDAFEIIGVKNQGETLPPNETTNGLRRLNQLIGQWSLKPLTMTATIRHTFPLVAGKGTPSNPYTVGIGGDFNMTRPSSLDAVGLLVTTATPPFELTRTLYTDAAYQSIGMKTLTSTYFAGAYLQATYDSGFARLYLYPIPTQLNEIVLYEREQIAFFPNLSTAVDLPPGAADAITYELARRLAKPYGRTFDPDLAKDASDYLAIFERMNTRMVDLTLDTALVDTADKRWNILTDP